MTDKEWEEWQEKDRRYVELWKQVYEKRMEEQHEVEERRKREAIKRVEEGRAKPQDYAYLQGKPKDQIAHQDDNIAHPDTMRKEPATVLLILGLLGSLIFKQWYGIWALLFWWYFSKNRV